MYIHIYTYTYMIRVPAPLILLRFRSTGLAGVPRRGHAPRSISEISSCSFWAETLAH